MKQSKAMKVSAILFDRDDTLCFTRPEVYHQAARWLTSYYPNIDLRDILDAMRAQWTASLPRWQRLRTIQDEAAFWDNYHREFAELLDLPYEIGQLLGQEWPYYKFLRLYPETTEVLERLRSQGYTLGVLSNTFPNIQITLEELNIQQYIDVSLASCSLGYAKPHPMAYELASQHLNLPMSEILFIDDRIENVEGARNAGMQALLIDRASRQRRKNTIHNLEDIFQHLKSKNITKAASASMSTVAYS